MMVKVCGVTSLDDALMTAEAGASAIGFNFYRPSPRFIEPSAAARIAQALSQDVLKVGIFVDAPAVSIAAIASEVGLDVVQLHGRSLAPGLRVWRAQRVNEHFNRALLEDAEAEAFLLDGAVGLHGGTGQTFDWTVARGLGKRIVLAGGLDASNIKTAIEQADPWGVDACSLLESEPGRKDPMKVRNFIKAALNL